MFEDEEKKRILAAIDEKIAGKQIVATEHAESGAGAQVIDLVEALRASLGSRAAGGGRAPARRLGALRWRLGRKGVKRAQTAEDPAAPVRVRAKK
jgi:DNA end-binding protein Ku